MAKWQKKSHLVDSEVRLGAHSLPAGQHVLEGDYWAQFSDVLERVPDAAPAKAAPPSMPPAPTPPPVAPPPPPADAPSGDAHADDAPSDGGDKPKKRGKGK